MIKPACLIVGAGAGIDRLVAEIDADCGSASPFKLHLHAHPDLK